MLKCRGLTHKVRQLARTPEVICVICGEEANSEDDVCSAVPLFI
jgi:hypothetical protein